MTNEEIDKLSEASKTLINKKDRIKFLEQVLDDLSQEGILRIGTDGAGWISATSMLHDDEYKRLVGFVKDFIRQAVEHRKKEIKETSVLKILAEIENNQRKQ